MNLIPDSPEWREHHGVKRQPQCPRCGTTPPEIVEGPNGPECADKERSELDLILADLLLPTFTLREKAIAAHAARVASVRARAACADLQAENARLTAALAEATAELGIWQHCANCHEKMDAPGHCSKAESESEKGWKLNWENALDQRDAAEAKAVRLTALLAEFDAFVATVDTARIRLTEGPR